MKQALVIVSGGLDSVTLAYYLRSKGYTPHLLSFDYGQRHKKELFFAKLCAERLNAAYSLIDIASLGAFLKGSALTDMTVDVPEGHYASNNMSVTVIPNRNAIMLAMAFSVAAAQNADVVAIGVHSGDHFIYPDCRPEFIERFEFMERASLGEYANVDLWAPFLAESKEDIIKQGYRLGVPFEETWSCYNGGDIHCGVCGTCIERRESFVRAGIVDPTVYQK